MSIINTQVKGLTSAEILAKAEKVQKASEKMTGKKRFKTQKIAAALRHLAKKQKAVRKTTAVPEQGLLPGFTGMVNNATVEEMARELIFKALSNQVSVEMGKIADVLKLKKA